MKKNIIAVAHYNGHSIKASGVVDLSFKFGYAQIVNVIQLYQFFATDVQIEVKQAGGSPFMLGSFKINGINTNGNGESTVKFNSLADFVEIDNLNLLISQDLMNVRFSAVLAIEEKEETEEE